MAISRKFLQPLNLLNASADPSPAVKGDLYFNSSSNKIRFYDGSQWKDVGSGSGAGVSVSETAPETPVLGAGWFKSSTSELFFWDGMFWIEATSVVDNFLLFEVAANSPANPIKGQGWLDTDDDSFYIYNGTMWKQVTSTNIVALDQDTSPSLIALLDANGYGIDNVDHVKFDTTPTVIGGAANLQWNDTDGTLDVGLKGGLALQVGQQNVAICYNGTGSTIAKGSVVYVSGVEGQRVKIAKASASSEATSSKTLGIAAEDILNGQSGFVSTKGIVRAVNTGSFTLGQELWLSATAGVITATKPTQPNAGVFIGYCNKIHATAGEIFISLKNGYTLNELNNVLITSAASGDVLIWDSATSLWKNSNGYATKSYVDSSITGLVNAAPATLDTLNELAAALGNDANFSTTITASIALKAPIASPTFTGVPSAPTATAGTNTTQVATTSFVQTAISGFQALPTQTSNAGKFLTTDGTTASWATVSQGSGGSVQTDAALSNSWWLGV